MRKATAADVLAGRIATATTALHFFRQLRRRRNVSNGRERGGRGDLLAAIQGFVEDRERGQASFRLGLTTSYSYFIHTGNQSLQEIKNLNGSTPLSKFDYTYNPVGTIATWTQQAESGTAVVNTLTYDNADQLVKEQTAIVYSSAPYITV